MADQLAGKRTKVRPTLVEPDFVIQLATELAKAEAEDGKAPRLSLVTPDFLVGMAKVMENGLLKDGRYPNCWMKLDPAEANAMYRDSTYRHLLEQLLDDDRLVQDHESGQDVLLHVATSAMILRHHLRAHQENRRADGNEEV